MLACGIGNSWGQMGEDIGSPWPPIPGSYTFDGTNWTVTGGGWTHLNYPYFDQCHYVFLPMKGDGEFVACQGARQNQPPMGA